MDYGDLTADPQNLLARILWELEAIHKILAKETEND